MNLVREAVLLAGGQGARLGSVGVPKPLVDVGDGRSLLRVAIEQLRSAGVCRVTIAVCHRAGEIIDAIGDGSALGVHVDYIHERKSLGTAGAIALAPVGSRPFFVANCDVVTDLALDMVVRTHRRLRSELTICAQRIERQSEFGVLMVDEPYADGARLHTIMEKPREVQFLNMGIYLLEPAVIDLIPRGRRFDMNELIQRLLERGRTVATHAHDGAWVDAGVPARLEALRRQRINERECEKIS